MLKGTPELDVIRSKSVMSLSSIVLIFKRGTDILHARQLVQERLAAGGNPAAGGHRPAGHAAAAVVDQPGHEDRALLEGDVPARPVDDRLLEDQLPSAARAGRGERADLGRAAEAAADPGRPGTDAAARGDAERGRWRPPSEALDFGLLPNSSSAKTQIVGFIETPNQRLDIRPGLAGRHAGRSGQGAGRVRRTASTVTLGDVAKVLWEQPLLIGDAVINDGPGLMLIVEKFPWANTLEVTRGVEAALDEMQPGLPDIEIDHQIFRPATFIELSIHNLTMALLIGAVLVVLVLGAFLFEWRVALISLVAIPLSLVAAVLVLYLRGHDDQHDGPGRLRGRARLGRRRRDHRRREHRAAAARASQAGRHAGRRRRSSSRPRSRSAAPIVYATLIIVLAVVPVFFMGGLSGAFFEPLALSYSLALLASMVVALTVTPALCLMLLDQAPVERESPLVGWLQRGYERALVADHPGAARGVSSPPA